MPHLTYARLPSITDVRLDEDRGYTEEFWKSLKKTRELVESVGLRKVVKAPISQEVLRAGTCPGLWRVYYNVVEPNPRTHSQDPHKMTEFLGQPIPGHIELEGQLGKYFEKMFSDAMCAYNYAIDAGGLIAENFEFPDNPIIQDYLRGRAQMHDEAPHGNEKELHKADLDQTWLEHEPPLAIPFGPPDPDGVFTDRNLVAVFESKRNNHSAEDWFGMMATLYALRLERATQKNCDFLIVTHVNGDIDTPVTGSHEIQQRFVIAIQANLEKFLRLVQASIAKKGSGRTWQKIVQRPDGLPPTHQSGACEKCTYRKRCYAEAGVA